MVPLVNNEIYHICYRAVGDAKIFKDENDHFRGIFSCYEFNNNHPVTIWKRRRDRIVEKKRESGDVGHLTILDERDKFLEIFAFCFMPNHIHLVVKQLKENGVSSFVQKLGSGYANYANRKYQRKGHLFNKFKAFHITSDNQLKNVITYVHCNPISLIEPRWKERGIKNPKRVLEFLVKYRWSSYQDYIGIKNFPSVTTRDFILELMNGEDGVQEAIKDWVAYKNEITAIDYVTLEL